MPAAPPPCRTTSWASTGPARGSAHAALLLLVQTSNNQVLQNVIAGNGTGAVPTTSAIGVNVLNGAANTADNNVIKGNFIGTNAAGALGLHNFGAGITLFSVSNTVVGGPTAADRNVIVHGNDIAIFVSAGNGLNQRQQQHQGQLHWRAARRLVAAGSGAEQHQRYPGLLRRHRHDHQHDHRRAARR